MSRILAIVAALLVASCGDSYDDVRTEIQVWVMPVSPEPLRDMERLVKGFQLENPGIKVNITVLDWGSAWTKITTAASAQNGPDLVQMPTTWAASVTEMGALVNLDSLVREMGGQQQFVDAMLEYARPRGSDSITSIPWFVDVRPLYYRKDVLASLGVAPESIRDAASFSRVLHLIRERKPVLQGEQVTPFGYPGKNDWNVIHNFAPWIWGAGGDFLDATATASAIGSENSIRGIMTYLDFVREGVNERRNLEKNTAQVSADFDEGRQAFWLDATIKTIYLDRPQMLGGGATKSVAARNYGVMLPPTSQNGKPARYFIGGSNLAVFKFSKHRQEALNLLRYMTARPQVQFQWARVAGVLPALKEAFDLPYFREDVNRNTFLQMVEMGQPYPSVHYWGEIETSILLRRFGNIFDMITEAPADAWPREGILKELRATDEEITRYIDQQLAKQPTLRVKLLQRAAEEEVRKIRKALATRKVKQPAQEKVNDGL